MNEIAPSPIRFRFAARKSLAALHRMVDAEPGIALHSVLMACYFADVAHLNAHGRPVFGARYRAMRIGPVPLEIYELAKAEPIWLAELGIDRLPWDLRGYRLHPNPAWNSPPDCRALSETDLAAIDDGLARARSMQFDQRTAATHGPDWQAARLGLMRYEDMLADAPDRPRLIAELRASAPFMRL